MASTLPKIDIDRLSVPERLALIAQLWDSLPESDDSLPIPEWHRQELDRRLAAAEANPAATVSWEQLRQELREQS